ncbi:uncharacterized protein LOC123666932 [Melitaea cinxia]|uniref:uncharacterized protein LOC123666932 n=1 Tax=Melitaea cinxia TaxID=113334 RepID=UPI001E271AE8|nr:uncharacterized protein LOC123666932 [Melitaea cinxia]
MIVNCLLILVGASLTSSAGIQVLFPDLKQYSYILKTNVSAGTPSSDSYWTLEARLVIILLDNFTRIRFKLEDYKTSLYSENSGYSSYQSEEATKYFNLPWEVDYQENGFIRYLYVSDEPVWCTNLKRAIANNFQLRKDTGSYTNEEPCLYESCLMVYTANGNTIRKYSSYQKASTVSETSWSSVPWGGDIGRGPPENIATSERLYEFSDNRLSSLNVMGVFQYRVSGHVLSVNSEISLYYDTESPSPTVEKLNMTRTSLQYQAGNFDDWTTGIRTVRQCELRNRTYEILLKIAKKGIDTDNIVKNASMIHNLDFMKLLDTVTKLSYSSLVKLFKDLVLGTSYDLETARNIFLEVVPHGRSDACARFIKYLVVEEKEKIEDATLLSLIRKLPFNVANHSQNLLEELEIFTKLGLDFPSDIRHAGILSFAVLVSKTAEARMVKQDYFDNIVVKYFRMYSDCPQYLDRMVWLQGLCSLGYTAESYIRTIYGDKTRNRHERLWASLACGHENRGYAALETSLPILLDEEEDLKLRIAALHDILSSGMRESDFLFIHNFILSSRSKELQRFWYTTVKSLDSNKYFSQYRNVADYVPFVAKEVRNPDTTYWATNNYIAVSGGPWLQLMSVGAEPAPSFAALTLSSGGARPYVASVYIIAEGVASNLFKKMYKLNSRNDNVEKLVKVLEKMKVMSLKTPEEIHIDIVVKIHDKTVYATHVNQSRFDSWNEEDIKKSVMEFLRFGSHINQQLAYYPIQMDVFLPTELGTPIRLQSSVATFTSIRGNITAPVEPADMLYWKNDLHIRYQATSVTSLSTSAPLLQSLHSVRLQRSLVTHLPIKFKIGVEPVKHKRITLTWPDPFGQHAGIAIHSRVQIEMDSQKGVEVFSVPSSGGEDDSGVFFDCERKMSGAEVVEKYIMSKFITYDTLPSQQTILNAVERFMTSSGCGLVIPPTRPPRGINEILHVAFNLSNTVEFDKMELIINTALRYYKNKNDSDREMYLKVDADAKVEYSGRNVTVQSFLYVNQPLRDNPDKRFWKLCYFEDDTSHAAADQDLNTHPAAYHGVTTIAYRSSPNHQLCTTTATTGDSRLTVEYRGTPKYSYGNVERYVEVDIKGQNLHEFDLLPLLGLGPGTPIAQLLGTVDVINTSAIIREKDGIASVAVNKGAEIQFESDSFAWLLDSWTAMQLMKRFGVYRECRLQESTVQTLSGNVDQLQLLQCSESLVLADCSETPSFVILRKQDGGIIMYDGEHASYNSDASKANKNTALIPTDDGAKVISNSTGVIIYRRYNETVILIPSSYLPSVCGECAGSGDYNNC